MSRTTFIIIFIAVFFFLLGFFPIIFYLIWSIQKKRKSKARKRSGRAQPKHYHLTRFKELRDNPTIRL